MIPITWSPIGPVKLDSAGALVFPTGSDRQGLYLLTLSGLEPPVAYVGQTVAQTFRQRFNRYESRSTRPDPKLPLDRATTSRNAACLVRAIRMGYAVDVSVAEVSDAEERREAEGGTIRFLAESTVLLSRNHNPHKTEHRAITRALFLTP